MEFVPCDAFLGGTKEIPRERLIFRPAVYGLIMHDDKVLLMNTIATNRFSLPGGGVEEGEFLEDALKREVLEETGLRVEVGRFAGFKEAFFYYDPSDTAYHSFLFYYFCRPLTFELASKDEIQDETVDQPQWLSISSLGAHDFHNHGDVILPMLQLNSRSHP